MTMTFLEYVHAHGETTYTLAKKSGVSVRTIEQYTAGRNRLSNARAHIVVALADALGVPAGELVELDNTTQALNAASKGGEE